MRLARKSEGKKKEKEKEKGEGGFTANGRSLLFGTSELFRGLPGSKKTSTLNVPALT